MFTSNARERLVKRLTMDESKEWLDHHQNLEKEANPELFKENKKYQVSEVVKLENVWIDVFTNTDRFKKTHHASRRIELL